MIVKLKQFKDSRRCEECGHSADFEKGEMFFVIQRETRKRRYFNKLERRKINHFICRDCLSTAHGFYKIFERIGLIPFVTVFESIKKLNEMNTFGFSYSWKDEGIEDDD